MKKVSGIDKYKYILRQRGVPEKFVSEIAARKGNFGWEYSIPIVWAILSTLLLGYIISRHTILDFLYPISINTSDIYIPTYFPASIFYVVLLIFVWSLPIWAMVAVAIRSGRDGIVDEKMLAQAATNLRLVGNNEDIYRIKKNPDFEQFSNLGSADEFLAEYLRMQSRAPHSRAPQRKNGLIFFGVQFAVVVAATLSTRYSYASIYGNAFEWRSPISHFTLPLSQANSVIVGCKSSSSYKGGATADYAYYDIRINGVSTDLFRSLKIGKYLTVSDRIAMISSYDRYLVDHGVPVLRLSVEQASFCAGEMKIKQEPSRKALMHILAGN
jgi:hypothetical protein